MFQSLTTLFCHYKTAYPNVNHNRIRRSNDNGNDQLGLDTRLSLVLPKPAKVIPKTKESTWIQIMEIFTKQVLFIFCNWRQKVGEEFCIEEKNGNFGLVKASLTSLGECFFLIIKLWEMQEQRRRLNNDQSTPLFNVRKNVRSGFRVIFSYRFSLSCIPINAVQSSAIKLHHVRVNHRLERIGIKHGIKP